MLWLKVGYTMRHIKKMTLLICSITLLSFPACTSLIQKEINNLHSSDLAVRMNAVKAIGEMNDPQVVEALSEAIEDRDLFVRRAAVETLAKVGDRHAVEPLLPVLADKNDGVRKAAL